MSEADQSTAPTPPAEPDPPADEKPTRSLAVVRLLSGTYSSLAVVGLCLFSLPWVEISCLDTYIMRQSGIEVTTGRIDSNRNFQQELQENFEREFGQEFGETGDSDRQAELQHDAFQKSREGMPIFPPLALFPAGLALVASFGLVGVLSNRPAGPYVPMIGASIAALSAVGCLTSDFPLEKGALGSREEHMRFIFTEVLDLERTPAYVGAMAVAFTVFGLVLTHALIVSLVVRPPETPSRSQKPLPEKSPPENDAPD